MIIWFKVKEKIYFHILKKKNISNEIGSLCCSISGSGPSIFSLARSYKLAKKIKLDIDKEFVKWI